MGSGFCRFVILIIISSLLTHPKSMTVAYLQYYYLNTVSLRILVLMSVL